MNDILYVTAGLGYPVIVAADCWQQLPMYLKQLGLSGRVHIVADQHLQSVATQLQSACGDASTLLILPGGETSKDSATFLANSFMECHK